MNTSITKLPEWLSWNHDVPWLLSRLGLAVSSNSSTVRFHSMIRAEKDHLVLVQLSGAISYIVIDQEALVYRRVKILSHLVVNGQGVPSFDKTGMPLRGLTPVTYWGDKGPTIVEVRSSDRNCLAEPPW